MFQFFSDIFNNSNLSPHGICLLWRPELITLHVTSDAIIALSYYSIPLALTYFVLKRRDVVFGWLFWMFGAFILACGTTHVFGILTLWYPVYGIEGMVKFVTAVVSFFTAVVLWPLLPRALALPSPAMLTRANEELSAEIDERNKALATLSESEERYRVLSETLQEEAAARRRVEEALRQSQKMEAVGQLTGGVAHDFNNLLTVILGNVAEARRLTAGGGAGDGASLEERLAAVDRAGTRAATLTHRLLAFSRRQPLAPRTLDLNRLVAGMSELLHRTLGEVMGIETVLGARLWLTRVDPNQLENALLNLVINARDAMQRGGKLTIETANLYLDENYAATDPEVLPGQYIMLAVTDTGTGMSEEVRVRAFEPFYTTKPVGRGSGLGLSMVYGFARQSGGHVRIYSELDQGTTVKLYLPRWFGEEEQTRLETTGREGPRMEGQEAILVVEDDDEVRSFVVRTLRGFGYHVREARDADGALAVMREQPVDLLLTDIGLPNTDGRQLATMARQLRPDLRVLYTTGYARNAIVHNGTLDAGVDMIPKPFSAEALGRTVRQILDRNPEPTPPA
jgi:signal transduction histidine kinase/ActR/RegA family two-component response regulator